ncbi:MAG: hypothetical protein E4H08_07360 [Candidatus Atribacteria bacterium]|nr:MAG: hypothetical protein E4H08_07360 [Candidatus Atribacteria bacterium]
MNFLVASLCMFFAGGLACLATTGRPHLTRWVGSSVALIGGALALVPTCMVLGGRVLTGLHLHWSMPFGSIALDMDALSAVFSTPILIIVMLAAVYGTEYLRPFEGKKNLAQSWFFYNLLAGSMLLVVVARNGMLFLLAWEIMSLASFFLVTFENEEESVREAGWIYLVATHIGTAFLLVLFVLLGRDNSTLDFSSFAASPGFAGIAFLLALVGFGTKAGFMPMHVWLPEAHPAAPSHVSAVMSGVMIKTGIYGLVRILTFLGSPPPWWGWLLVSVGAISGILGVLFALAQHDLKRLLAYHSVENMGIITMGLGIGLLGMSYQSPVVAFLGFAGSFLHVMNHALFKSLLFLSAGSVIHGSGTRDIDHMGGLLKRMPVTGLVFLLGSVAICGLPPLNGFVSEFMIYLGSLTSVAGNMRLPIAGIVAALVVAGSLALIGGLAVACFTKAFGIMFLGEARSTHAAHVHESGLAMRLPMAVLAAACIIIGVSGPFWMQLLGPAIAVATGVATDTQIYPTFAAHALWMMTLLAVAGIGLVGLLTFVRSRLLSARSVTREPTWDCGYASSTPRMQYTASSFAEPVTRMFNVFLRTRRRFSAPTTYFPTSSSFSTETRDLFHESLFRPAFTMTHRFLSRIHWLQHGRLNLYILSMIAALLVLLVWKLG